MKYALLIYPKPDSDEALGEDESESVSPPSTGRFARTRVVWAALTCSPSRRRPRFATAAVRT